MSDINSVVSHHTAHAIKRRSWWPIRRDPSLCVGGFCVGVDVDVLYSFDLLCDGNWAKTFSNWFEKWIENNFKNDRPEFSNTSHFNLVRSFKRRIEPNVCASDKSFYVFLPILCPFTVYRNVTTGLRSMNSSFIPISIALWETFYIWSSLSLSLVKGFQFDALKMALESNL